MKIDKNLSGSYKGKAYVKPLSKIYNQMDVDIWKEQFGLDLPEYARKYGINLDVGSGKPIEQILTPGYRDTLITKLAAIKKEFDNNTGDICSIFGTRGFAPGGPVTKGCGKEFQQALDNDDLDYAECLQWQFDTGMRWDGEVNVFQYKDIDFKTQSITFQRRKTGNNWSVIPLTSRCIAVAKRRSKFALANGGRLFTYTRSQLRHKWDLTRRMAGLDKKYSSYCTRHTCCTRLVESGLPANVIKDWMGHKSIMTSMTYYAKSSPKLMNKAVNALEGYNQEYEKIMEDNKKSSMIGHNSKNRLK